MMHVNNKAINFIKVLGGVSLVLAPLLTFIGWSIAHDSLGSLLNLGFTYKASDATANLTASSVPTLLFRYYLLPHYFIYSSMPVYVGLALYLMYVSYKKTPWHSFIGAILSIIGAVYFIGVLGAFLSAPMGTTPMTNILKISMGLMMLLFIGNLMLGFALLQSKILPKWSPWLFISGNLLILIFPGIENWMALGCLLMIIGLFPLSKRTISYHLR
jgi:hypothetical protein